MLDERTTNDDARRRMTADPGHHDIRRFALKVSTANRLFLIPILTVILTNNTDVLNNDARAASDSTSVEHMLTINISYFIYLPKKIKVVP